MTEIKFDIGRLTLADLMSLFQENVSFGTLIDVMDKASEEDILDISAEQLPALMSGFTKELHEHVEVIAIAVSSMTNFYLGLDDDDE